jgi:hypothetical protein
MIELSQDLITQEVTSYLGVEIHIHASVNSALRRRKGAASDFGFFTPGKPLRNPGKHPPAYTLVTT